MHNKYMKTEHAHYSINIPQELQNFIEQDTYSLLIKGDVGTGKTTLALSILLALQIKKNCLYLSTRTSPERLFKHFTWLENFFDQSKKLDLVDASELATDIATFVDSRLDEPASLYERITNELMDVKSPIIVIDSWNAISASMDQESLVSNAKVLQTWRERAGAKVIFISEGSDDASLDFLVDGIVELKKEYKENRTLREIFFHKLHGVQIKRPTYFFSLYNSVFNSYDPLLSSNFDKIFSKSIDIKKISPPIHDNHVNTGYDQLDLVLGGGIPLRSTILIELDSHVDVRVPLLILSNLISNFVSTGNFAIIHSFEGLKKDFVEKFLDKIIISQTKSDLTSIIYPEESHIDNNVSGIDSNPLTTYRDKLVEITQNKKNKQILSILGSNILDYFRDDQTKLRSFLNFNKHNSNLTFFINRSTNKEMSQILSEFAEIYFKITEISGNLFLQGKIPWSHLFAIVIKTHNGKSKLVFEPVV